MRLAEAELSVPSGESGFTVCASRWCWVHATCTGRFHTVCHVLAAPSERIQVHRPLSPDPPLNVSQNLDQNLAISD